MCDLTAQNYLKAVNETNILDDSTFFIDKRENIRNKLTCIKVLGKHGFFLEKNEPNIAKRAAVRITLQKMKKTLCLALDLH